VIELYIAARIDRLAATMAQSLTFSVSHTSWKKKVSFISVFRILFVGLGASLGPGPTNLGSIPVISSRFVFLLSEGPIMVQCLIGWVLASLSVGVKRSWCEAECSSQYIVEVKTKWSRTCTPLPTGFCPSFLSKRNLQ
jgi:hypothetical protein